MDFQITTAQDWDWKAKIINEIDKWVETYFLTAFMETVTRSSNEQMRKVQG